MGNEHFYIKNQFPICVEKTSTGVGESSTDRENISTSVEIHSSSVEALSQCVENNSTGVEMNSTGGKAIFFVKRGTKWHKNRVLHSFCLTLDL